MRNTFDAEQDVGADENDWEHKYKVSKLRASPRKFTKHDQELQALYEEYAANTTAGKLQPVTLRSVVRA